MEYDSERREDWKQDFQVEKMKGKNNMKNNK